jgi:hypothetical protein
MHIAAAIREHLQRALMEINTITGELSAGIGVAEAAE